MIFWIANASCPVRQHHLLAKTERTYWMTWYIVVPFITPERVDRISWNFDWMFILWPLKGSFVLRYLECSCCSEWVTAIAQHSKLLRVYEIPCWFGRLYSQIASFRVFCLLEPMLESPSLPFKQNPNCFLFYTLISCQLETERSTSPYKCSSSPNAESSSNKV